MEDDDRTREDAPLIGNDGETSSRNVHNIGRRQRSRRQSALSMVCVYVTYFCWGVATFLMGLTLLVTERQFNFYATAVSCAVVVTSIVLLLITSLTCSLTWNQYELWFCIANVFVGACTVAAPYIGQIGGVKAMWTVITAAAVADRGYMSCCVSYFMRSWYGNQLTMPSVKSMGSELYLVIFFLCDSLAVLFPVGAVFFQCNHTNQSDEMAEQGFKELQGHWLYSVRYYSNATSSNAFNGFTFTFLGLMHALPATLFLAAFTTMSLSILPKSATNIQLQQRRRWWWKQTPHTINRHSSPNRFVALSVAIMVLFFYVFAHGFDFILITYQNSILMEHLDLTWCAAVTWLITCSCQNIGLVFYVFTSLIARPGVKVTLELSLTVVAGLLTLQLIDRWPHVGWISSTVIGFASACYMGDCLLLIDHLIDVSEIDESNDTGDICTIVFGVGMVNFVMGPLIGLSPVLFYANLLVVLSLLAAALMTCTLNTGCRVYAASVHDAITDVAISIDKTATKKEGHDAEDRQPLLE